MENILIDTDSYKYSHFLQFPPKATGMYSYLESRGGRFDKTIFFGLQYILK
jgi:nicotinamide phosphoribosyltransferase